MPLSERRHLADAYASTGQGFNGTNMFCYCLNNPVNNADYGGTEAILIAALGLLITGLAAAVTAIAAGNLIEGAVNGVCDLLVGVIDEVVSPATGTSAPPSSYGSYDTGYAANAPSGYASTSSIPYAASLQNSRSKSIDYSINKEIRRFEKIRYWSAQIVNDNVVLKYPLPTKQAAITELHNGGDVFTVTAFEAKDLAISAGYNINQQIHYHGTGKNGDYYYHYHYEFPNGRSHIWFLYI